MTFVRPSTGLAAELVQLLKESELKIVCAESCTAGLLAATLGQVAGVSQVFCGSSVTYRCQTKAGWLDVDQKLLDDPAIGPVSVVVAQQMAWGALQRTPEADLAVSVTGHLGPAAPEGFDGLVFSGICQRGVEATQVDVNRYELPERYTSSVKGDTLRALRQYDLVQRILQDLLLFLQQKNSAGQESV